MNKLIEMNDNTFEGIEALSSIKQIASKRYISAILDEHVKGKKDVIEQFKALNK